MEDMKMENTQSKHLVGSILCGVLTAFSIVALIISMLAGGNGLWFFCDCVQILLLLLVIFYAFIGYKKPHGNILKFIILLRIVPILIGIPALIEKEYVISIILLTVEIGLTCYIAGRLAKAKENLVLMIIATICEVMSLFLQMVAGLATIGAIGPLIIWLDICVAYFLRYKEHKEAGLMDAPKECVSKWGIVH